MPNPRAFILNHKNNIRTRIQERIREGEHERLRLHLECARLQAEALPSTLKRESCIDNLLVRINVMLR